MAYGPSLSEISRRAGVMAGKILNGVNPAELPVEHPTKFDFVLNLKTAKALGLRSLRVYLWRQHGLLNRSRKSLYAITYGRKFQRQSA